MQTQSPLDGHRADVESLWSEGASYAAIIQRMADRGVRTSERSLRRALRRWEITPAAAAPTKAYKPEKPGARIQGDRAEVVSRPGQTLGSPTDLLIERGLDPEEWEVTSVVVNEWDSNAGMGEIITLKQLKISAARRKPYNFIFPAQDGPSYRAPTKAVYKWDNARLVFFMGDHQAPHVDLRLHDAACRWIERNKPDQGVLMGDGIDLPEQSRHPANPEWDQPAQTCLNSFYAVARDIRQANEDMELVKLVGNHDERIRNSLVKYLGSLYDLRPAEKDDGTESLPVWHLRNLLRLDDLNIRLIEPDGGYTHAQFEVSQLLAARHGWLAKKGAGSTALASLDALGYSLVVGHTHRQALVHKTTHDINGTPSTLVAIETGCMCRIQDGLGYAVAPDWQNGFATAIVHGDGTFKPELATYVGKTLMWRDQRF